MPKDDKAQDKAKPSDKQAAKPDSSASDAHQTRGQRMDPALAAKRSGPAPDASDDMMPKPLADPTPPEVNEPFDRSGEPSEPIESIEAKLQDPTFDPEGHERLRLAQESRRQGSGAPYPRSTNVDERGDPMEPGERNEGREA